MAFRPSNKDPEFADLKGMLAQSKQTDNALYQTLSILIDRLELVRGNQADVINRINNSVNNITSIVNITPNVNATYLTTDNEALALPFSRQLLAGANIVFDDTQPNKRIISATGGSGGGGGMNLDYLGDFVTGPVYNDGDIVLGADGVLYICTVDGTTTPPEPWPGQGVAVNVALDAKYWVVSPHISLTNARPLNSLGTGYVRSTAGEPSVVPTIPLTDTTGILPDNRLTSNVALKNINNNFSASQTFPGASIVGGNSVFTLQDTTSPVDARVWRLLNYSSGALYVEALNDAGTVQQTIYTFDRSGLFTAPKLSGNGAAVTALNASNLATGVANQARLGLGTYTNAHYLRGDGYWATLPASDGFPSGLMVLSNTPCPAGWTRITAWDGMFIRSNSVHQAGGTTSHTHGSGSLGIPAHDHGGQVAGTTDYDGTHGHSWGGSFSGRTSDSIGQTSGADQGGSFTAPYSAHSHDYSGTVGGQTGDAGNHAHNFRTGIPSQGGIGVTGGTGAADHIPPFVDLFICQKN